MAWTAFAISRRSSLAERTPRPMFSKTRISRASSSLQVNDHQQAASPGLLGGQAPPLPDDRLVTLPASRADDDRLNQAELANRVGQALKPFVGNRLADMQGIGVDRSQVNNFQAGGIVFESHGAEECGGSGARDVPRRFRRFFQPESSLSPAAMPTGLHPGLEEGAARRYREPRQYIPGARSG